ncbi:hypothetical protein EJ02DRAFT_455446 [Clathrospora elynae]|uniref:Uncharacterized protein n=1 Tax=Clathrospora elynae TaxID=706981 RepID=A0A6A5SKJ6_9PLEO|nr:hypothetical protein EJ02DRAFT_455446 [Clathrospora elynae]
MTIQNISAHISWMYVINFHQPANSKGSRGQVIRGFGICHLHPHTSIVTAIVGAAVVYEIVFVGITQLLVSI